MANLHSPITETVSTIVIFAVEWRYITAYCNWLALPEPLYRYRTQSLHKIAAQEFHAVALNLSKHRNNSDLTAELALLVNVSFPCGRVSRPAR